VREDNMPELKLAKLPDRTPVKLTISVTPDVYRALADYAEMYAAQYGQREAIADLIPAMISAFLESDRSFSKGRPVSVLRG
jgi:hypothetical protein